MLPLPPLDGASAISFSLLGIFIVWQVFPYFVDPFFGALLKVVHPGSGAGSLDGAGHGGTPAQRVRGAGATSTKQELNGAAPAGDVRSAG